MSVPSLPSKDKEILPTKSVPVLDKSVRPSFTPVQPTVQNYDHTFKIVLIGESGVGKSCLLVRFVDDKFVHSRQGTIGVDFKYRTLHSDGATVKLQIWDTAGQEKFKTIRSAYYRSLDGIVVVYDITRKETFDRVPLWLDEAFKYSNDNPQKLLVGAKSDLAATSRQVKTEEAEAFAKSKNMQFFETSAMTGEKIIEAFTAMTKTLLLQKRAADAAHSSRPKDKDTVQLDGENKGFLSNIPCCNK